MRPQGGRVIGEDTSSFCSSQFYVPKYLEKARGREIEGE